MAVSTAATVTISGAVAAPMRSSSEFASSAAYGSRFLQVAPFRPASKRLTVVAKASLSEEPTGKAARRELLAGLTAVSAAIFSSGNAWATSTGEKAQNLLKNADDLTNNESPARFGPPQTGDSNPGAVAQKAGAGAVEQLQGGSNDVLEGAKKTVEEAKQNVDNLFGGKKGGSLPDLGLTPDVEDVKQKVTSDISTTQDKVKSDISTTEEGVKGLGQKLNDSKGSAGSIVADAQGKVQDGRGKGKEVFDDLQKKFFSLGPQ